MAKDKTKKVKAKAKTEEKTGTANSIQQSGRDPKTGRFLNGHKFSSAPTKWTEEKAMELAEGLLKWMKDSPNHFMLGDYLFSHDLYADVISYLSERYPQFAEYIARAKEIEAHRIQQYALINKLNSGMAQWVLAVHHNQHNVQKTEVSGKDGAPLEAPTITIMPVAVKKDEDGEKDE